MCGIAGLWSKNRQPRETLAGVADRMLTALAHRGPDDGGFAVGPNFFIGNRRLSIFDLSPAGHQPFFSDDGKIWLVYNGEVFNYVEIRRELESEFHFHSSTDTEVILHAYEKWGIRCLEKFVGMFAFALWDAGQQKMIICRDRLGIKPLYFAWHGDDFVFGSEIKALLAAGVHPNPNMDAIRDFMVDGYYDHTEQTLFRGIWKVMPGHYLTVSNGTVETTCFWNLADRVKAGRQDSENAADRYWSTLEESVELRMRSDVPYAVMLSGGLDSSSLAVLANEHVRNSKLNVLTFRHKEEKYDEGPWADLVSKGKDWNALSITTSESDVERLLPSALWHQEEPFGGVAIFSDVILAQLAREKGIYVLLEGQGADETLAGYEYYYIYYLADLADKDPVRALDLFRIYARRRNLNLSQEESIWAATVAKGRQVSGKISQDGTQPTQQGVLSAELMECPGTGFLEPRPFESRLDNMLYRDLVSTKLPRVLRFKDKSSMMHGVELRVPFLDHRLVEMSFCIPPEEKLADGYTKYYLRNRMASRLPADTAFHVKRQVQTPQREWLRGALRPMVEEAIFSGSFATRGFFNADAVRKLYRDYHEHPEKYSNSFFIWQWLSMEWWCRLYLDKPFPSVEIPKPTHPNVERFPKTKP